MSSGFNRGQFIATDSPYGTGTFGMAGASVELRIDRRDFPGFARKGAALLLRVEGYPALLDAERAVARVEAQGSLAVAPVTILRRRPSLHFMAGGIQTWGRAPYFLAATLGGPERLRGYYSDRFAGDAAIFGSVELRLPISRFKLLFPGEQGVFGFVDAGRVYRDAASPGGWHHTVGGGVWFSFVRQDYVVFLALARPELRGEGNRLLFGLGFPY